MSILEIGLAVVALVLTVALAMSIRANRKWAALAESLSETPEQYAARVDRLVNDPDRIERRKGIAPALIVKRHHEDQRPDRG